VERSIPTISLETVRGRARNLLINTLKGEPFAFSIGHVEKWPVSISRLLHPDSNIGKVHDAWARATNIKRNSYGCLGGSSKTTRKWTVAVLEAGPHTTQGG